MNINEIENLKQKEMDRALANVTPKGFLDLLKDVKEGKVLPITNSNGDIIGVNCTHKATAFNVVKQISGHMTFGKDASEQFADEVELRKFMKAYSNVPLLDYFQIALKFVAANINPVIAYEEDGRLICKLEDGSYIDKDGNDPYALKEETPYESCEYCGDEPVDNDCGSNNCRGCEGCFQDSRGRWRDCHGRFISR